MANYQVVVGNIGTVYEGGFYDSALGEFYVYKNKSQQDTGRASGEPVTLLKDGEIIREYQPDSDEPEAARETSGRTEHDALCASRAPFGECTCGFSEEAEPANVTPTILEPLRLQDVIVEAIAKYYSTTVEAVVNDIASAPFAQGELDSLCESLKSFGY